MKRLTREQKKAQTRERLLDAAWRVFAEHGFQAASVEAIADEAGFSTGAVYSNFHSKSELFLALFEERIGRRLGEIQEDLGGDMDIRAQVGRAGQRFAMHAKEDRAWFLLLFEFWAHAARDERFREAFRERKHAAGPTLSGIVEERLASLDVNLGFPPRRLVTAITALAYGLALERLIDPDAVPDELFGDVLGLIVQGALVDQAEERGNGGGRDHQKLARSTDFSSSSRLRSE